MEHKWPVYVIGPEAISQTVINGFLVNQIGTTDSHKYENVTLSPGDLPPRTDLASVLLGSREAGVEDSGVGFKGIRERLWDTS